ncbi:hypothetical protein HRbin41_00996 [bacterium HR41]|nr:hypothetical protein HRbin41_00996 [bacterium HR41]
MVARLREFDQFEVAVEVALAEEGSAVDACELLAARVAAPVGTGDGGQLERTDAPRRRPVRSAAEVEERAVAIERHRFDPLVAHQIVDQLDLVRLPFALEQCPGFRGWQLDALELLIGLDVRAHPLLDRRQILDRHRDTGRKLEVVVEAVVDRRPDRDLRPGPQLEHRFGENVSGVVADQPQRPDAVLAAALGEDFDAVAIRERLG